MNIYININKQSLVMKFKAEIEVLSSDKFGKCFNK